MVTSRDLNLEEMRMTTKKKNSKKEIIVYGHYHCLKLIPIDEVDRTTLLSDGLRIQGFNSYSWPNEVEGYVIEGIFDNLIVSVDGEEVGAPIPEVNITDKIRNQNFIVAYEGKKIWYQGFLDKHFDLNSIILNIRNYDFSDESESYIFVGVEYPGIEFVEIDSKTVNEGYFLIDADEGIINLEVTNDGDDGFSLITD
jgi:hypothetical protein